MPEKLVTYINNAWDSRDLLERPTILSGNQGCGGIYMIKLI